MWGGPRIGRTPPPGPSTPRRSPPAAAASPAFPAAPSFSLLGRTSSRTVVQPHHLADFDCSGEELPRRRRGRVRASDLWSQPGGGEEDDEAGRGVDVEPEVEEGQEVEERVSDNVVVAAVEAEEEEEEDVVNDVVEVNGEGEEEEQLPEQEVVLDQANAVM